MVWLAVWFFNCFDMLGFCYWWTKTIRCSKFSDEKWIVDVGMLAWEWDSIRANTLIFKDYTFLMERCNGMLDFFNIIFIKNWAAYKVAELHEAANCLQYLWWNIASNFWKINLLHIISWDLRRNMKSNLHKCLRIITCPLLKAMVWKGKLTQLSSLHFQGIQSMVPSGWVYLVKCPLSTFPLYKLLLLIINTIFYILLLS